MTESLSFVHLRVHTAYSLLEGALKIPQLIDLVKKHSMPAIAITDTANLFGALEFSQACAKAGVQPIIGTQIKIAMHRHALDLRTLPSVVLLVQTEQGYKNLLALMRMIYTTPNAQGVPYISFDQLKEHSQGLMCLSGGVDGPIGHALLSHKAH